MFMVDASTKRANRKWNSEILAKTWSKMFELC